MLRAGDTETRATYKLDCTTRRGLGTHVVGLHTHLVDRILIDAFTEHSALLPKKLTVTLVAVGGYGRAELHPHSDIDLLLLLGQPRYDAIAPFAEAFLHFLWDIGLTVGHSVRSVRDCLTAAAGDVTVMTSLMEARLLTGDEGLMADLVHRLHSPRLWPSARFYAAKREEQRIRHARYNDTGYNLEPNVKEGPGGLRDLHVIAWIARRHLGSSDFHELVRIGFLNEHEYQALIDNRNFLWHVRNGLHLLARRREDRLLFDHQRALAQEMGFADRPGRLAVEQFMKRYYRAVAHVRLLNEITLQHFGEVLTAPRRTVVRPLAAHFAARNDFLEVTDPQLFSRTPAALFDLFALLEQHPGLKGVRAATIRLVRQNVHRIDSDFRHDPDAQARFMRLMRAEHGVTHALRRINAYGVLGAYIPAFGKIVGQMQHDLFHVYTVDEHSLFVLRNVRRVLQPEFAGELPLASEIGRALAKPERLYLAALFHDIAKGRGGDHSRLGEAEALHFCQRHGLSEYDTGLITWLVRHHLVMSQTAQHSDISDPEVVKTFAQRVGDQEHLDHLYLLTVADIRATSPTLWNAWKGRLLSQLYMDTRRTLRRGIGVPIDIGARVTDIQRDAIDIIGTRLPGGDIERYFARMGHDYFIRHSAEAVAWHALSVAAATPASLPIVNVRLAPDESGAEFLVFGAVDDELFSLVTGSFERLQLSILDARVHVAGECTLACFVTLTDEHALPAPALLDRLRAQVRDDLLSRRAHTITHSIARALRHFPITTEISFTDIGRGMTTMEVVAQDRPGLLHQVALALRACRVRLVTAKVATFGERADDVFYLADEKGDPLGTAGPARLEALAAEVRRRVDGAR